MGYSRDSFYSIKELYDTGGGMALQEISPNKPIPKNRVAPKFEEASIQMAFDRPSFGQVRASNELREIGIFISSAGIRCVWQRNILETFQKRLKALKSLVAQELYHTKRGSIDGLERKKGKAGGPW